MMKKKGRIVFGRVGFFMFTHTSPISLFSLSLSPTLSLSKSLFAVIKKHKGNKWGMLEVKEGEKISFFYLEE